MDASDKSDSIELLVEQLIAKVDASQSLIDELTLRLESQVIENKKVLEKMQSELEHYFLLSQRQFEIIKKCSGTCPCKRYYRNGCPLFNCIP